MRIETGRKLGAAVVFLVASVGINCLSDDDIDGCIVDKDDKAYLVYKDGRVTRNPMEVHEGYCADGSIRDPIFYNRLDLKAVNPDAIPSTFTPY